MYKRQAAQYDTAIHYNDNGEWKDIDNTLSLQDAVDSQDFSGFITAEGGQKFKFSANSNSKKIFRIKKENKEVSFGLISEGKNNVRASAASGVSEDGMSEDEKKLNLEKLSSRITYPEILNNVDLEYIIKGNNVKENIVVKEPVSYTHLQTLLPSLSLYACL